MLLVLAGLPFATATDAVAQVAPNGTAVINEIHYNPIHYDSLLSAGPSEYIEICNISASSPLILDCVMLSGGVDYTFPPGTVLDQVRESVRNEASCWQVQTR